MPRVKMWFQALVAPPSFRVPACGEPRNDGGSCRTGNPGQTLLSALAAFVPFALTPALAHTGGGATIGFAAGFAHPIGGLDHLLAMVAVGLWAALIGGRALWAWPAAFLTLMVLGAGLGLQGVTPPGVEVAIGLSVVAFGAAVALRAPLPLIAGGVVCGGFALFHGLAHGTELPHGAGAASYVAGFALATVLLHLAGIAFGAGFGRTAQAWLPRLGGGAVATVGLLLLAGG